MRRGGEPSCERSSSATLRRVPVSGHASVAGVWALLHAQAILSVALVGRVSGGRARRRRGFCDRSRLPAARARGVQFQTVTLQGDECEPGRLMPPEGAAASLKRMLALLGADGHGEMLVNLLHPRRGPLVTSRQAKPDGPAGVS